MQLHIYSYTHVCNYFCHSGKPSSPDRNTIKGGKKGAARRAPALVPVLQRCLLAPALAAGNGNKGSSHEQGVCTRHAYVRISVRIYTYIPICSYKHIHMQTDKCTYMFLHICLYIHYVSIYVYTYSTPQDLWTYGLSYCIVNYSEIGTEPSLVIHRQNICLHTYIERDTCISLYVYVHTGYMYNPICIHTHMSDGF